MNKKPITMNAIIDKHVLIDYLSQNQVVWQKWDGLIEVSHEAAQLNNSEFIDAVEKCENFKKVDSNEIYTASFNELVDWSSENDALVICDDEILLCIPIHEFNRYIKLR